MTDAFKWPSLLRYFLNAYYSKPVDTRATIATCAGCVRCRLDRNTPFSRRHSRDAAAASLVPKMTKDPGYCSWTPRASPQARSELSSS